MDELESVKRRVKKLLALSKSPNENEAALALKKANELMAEHKLDIGQFSEYTRQTVKDTKRLIKWRSILANAMERLYATYHYVIRDTGQLFFVGEELDAFMAAEMYKYLVKAVLRMTKNNIRKNAKQKFRESYREGLANRLYDRMEELGQQCSWRNPKELEAAKEKVENFVKGEVAIVVRRKKRGNSNQRAFARGMSDANGISLSRQMTGSGVKAIGAR